MRPVRASASRGRTAKQARSREAWGRVLAVGRHLVEEGGVEALTVTEVCRRSGISPPSLYARVDGKAGLFAAVYERGMADIASTEERVFAGLPRVLHRQAGARGGLPAPPRTHRRRARVERACGGGQHSGYPSRHTGGVMAHGDRADRE
jgi:AcrR family transcriptional regulator